MAWGRTRSRSTDFGSVSVGLDNEVGTPQHGYTPTRPGYPTSGTKWLGGETTVTEDFVTPNFRAKINDGAIVNNPFKRTTVRETHTPPGSFLHLYRNTTGYNCSNGHSTAVHYTHNKTWGTFRPTMVAYKPLGSALSAMRSDVIDTAVTQAHANIDVSEMLALATAAESGKSVQSMMSIYSRLRKILRRARRLDVAGLRKELSPKELADRWMEVRYAIRPLVYDAAGIANSLMKNRGYERRTFRAQASDSKAESDVLTKQSVSFMTYTDWTRTNTYTVSARAGVLCDVSINDLTVFGIDQLLETMWELAPLSFIVDWFVQVGDWIAAHTPNAGVNQRASWVTVQSTLTQVQSTGSFYPDYGTWKVVNVTLTVPSATSTREELVLERIVNPAISTFPTSDIKLDTYKLTDLGIILKKYLK